MPTYTLSELTSGARRRSDQENSDLCSNAEVEDYLQQGNTALYDILAQDHYGLFETRTTVQTAAGVDTVSISPLDDGTPYKLLEVDLLWQGRYYPLRRYNRSERGLREGIEGWSHPSQVRYRMVLEGPGAYDTMGWVLRFTPTPQAVHDIRITYMPEPPTLSNSALFPIPGWAEYIMLYAAIQMAMKEESKTMVVMLEGKLMQCQERILNHIRTPDAGQGETIPNEQDFGALDPELPWWTS
jgi:hypothetical protein